jgi:hypothetical protein
MGIFSGVGFGVGGVGVTELLPFEQADNRISRVNIGNKTNFFIASIYLMNLNDSLSKGEN